MLRYILAALTLGYAASNVDSYRILCVFPVPSQSHNTLGRGMVRALLADGHEVTWVSPFAEKTPVKNLKHVDISEVQDITKGNKMMTKEQRSSGLNMVKEMSKNITVAALKLPAFREAVINGKYDAVIIEWFFTDLFTGLAAIHQVPLIVMTGMVMNPHIEYLIDTPQSPAVLPLMMNDFPVPMGFLDRVKNTLFVAGMLGTNLFIDQPATETLYQDIYGPMAAARGVPLPAFKEALHNISVVFVNSHPVIAHAQSLPPNVVEVGGFHLDENTPPLPQDLQTLLDASPQGVIYFSMGSVLKSSHFPEHTRKGLLKIFEDLPYTVLWKFEEKMENLPKNVHILSWAPQQSILAHPNVKLFITHGGMLSCIEAIHFGIPLLAVPMFGDQPSNAARAVRRGYALAVPYSDDMAPEIRAALDQLLNDESYFKTAKRLSKYFRTRLLSPSKTIAHYTRLAIESGGAFHLRSKAQLYSWYERLLLDQLAVVFGVIVFVFLVIKTLCKTPAKKQKKSKKN